MRPRRCTSASSHTPDQSPWQRPWRHAPERLEPYGDHGAVAFFERHYETFTSGSPFAVERLASALCAEWYLNATHRWTEFHPLGYSPTTSPLRALLVAAQSNEGVGDVDAALLLARTLGAFFPLEDESAAVLAELEPELEAQGAAAPSWAGDLTLWRATDARAQFLTDECPVAAGEQLAIINMFEHANGDRHCMSVTVSPLDRGAASRIDLFADVDTALSALNRRRSFPFMNWPRTTRTEQLAQAQRQLIDACRYAYKYEFSRIQGDPWTCGGFALMRARINAFDAEP